MTYTVGLQLRQRGAALRHHLSVGPDARLHASTPWAASSAINTTQGGQTQAAGRGRRLPPVRRREELHPRQRPDLHAAASTSTAASPPTRWAAQTFAIGYDAASRIEFISEVGEPAQHQHLRLRRARPAHSRHAPGTPYGYSYDAVGNRLSRTAGAGTDTYAYSEPTSNRHRRRVGPGAASPSTRTARPPRRQQHLRLRHARAHGAGDEQPSAPPNYQVNALGQRIRKTNSLGDTVFHYDTQGS